MRKSRRAVLASAATTVTFGGCLSLGNLGGQTPDVHFELDEVGGIWTTYAGGTRNRGHSRESNPHSEASIAWEGNYGETTRSQPLVYDDRVFVARENAVLCVNVEDGSVQ